MHPFTTPATAPLCLSKVRKERLNISSSEATRVTTLRSPECETLLVFVTDLLNLLKFIARVAARQHSESYCAELDQYTARAAQETDAFRLELLRDNCLKSSEEFFRRWEKHLEHREQELRDLINLLLNAFHTLAKDNESFNAALTASNERMQLFCDLNDISELKTRLLRELSQIKKAIAEKRDRDAAQLATLSERVSTLQAQLEQAEQKAQLDGLTGIYNRVSFDQKIAQLVSASSPFVLVIFDIDNFKRINDTHGHQIGDRVIVSAAVKLNELARSSDFLARYGGEEFALIHLGSKLEHSLPRITSFLKEVANTRYEYQIGHLRQELSFTLSAGATEFAPGDTVESVIKRADNALYQAKKQGKNQAVALRRGS